MSSECSFKHIRHVSAARRMNGTHKKMTSEELKAREKEIEIAKEAHKEIQDLFENDVKDLLGIRRVNPKKQIYAIIFDLLIHSIIYTGDGNVDRADYFRLKLIHILQENISFKIQVPLISDFSLDGMGIVLSDIGRAKAWTEMLAARKEDEDDDLCPSRTFNFKRDLFSEHPREAKN